MRLVCISGPRAAGKERLKSHLETAFRLRRVVPHTTREKRGREKEGREYYYVSPEKFGLLDQANEFAVQTVVGIHRYGTTRNELFQSNDCNSGCVIDITPKNARLLKEVVLEQGGRALLVFVYASEAERRRRIHFRQPELVEEEIERMISSEPAPADLGLYLDFDVVVENPDGGLQRSIAQVERVVRRFLE